MKNLIISIRPGLATWIGVGVPPLQMILIASLDFSFRLELERSSLNSSDKFSSAILVKVHLSAEHFLSTSCQCDCCSKVKSRQSFDGVVIVVVVCVVEVFEVVEVSFVVALVKGVE